MSLSTITAFRVVFNATSSNSGSCVSTNLGSVPSSFGGSGCGGDGSDITASEVINGDTKYEDDQWIKCND